MRNRGLFIRNQFITLLVSTLLVVFFAGTVSAEPIRLMLNWVADSEHAGWFAGLEKGFYKEQGLDLTIIPGAGSAKAVKAVAAKTAEYGEADMGEIIKGRSQGIPVRPSPLSWPMT